MPVKIIASADVDENTVTANGSSRWFLDTAREGAKLGCRCGAHRGPHIGVGVRLDDNLAPCRIDDELPETKVAARERLSLSVHPSVSEADLEHIVDAVNTWAEKSA